jgi:hypothetical protein
MLKNLSNTQKTFLYLFLAALVVRGLVFIWVWNSFGVAGVTMGDTIGYTDIADNLNSGFGFGRTMKDGSIVADMFRTPLYPLLLSGSQLLTGGFLLALILQIIVGSLISGLTFLLGREVGMGNFKSLILASGLTVIEPLTVVFSFLLLTETIFIAFLLASLIFLAKAFKSFNLKHAALAGLFLAMATLARPITAYYPLFIILLIGGFWLFRQIEFSKFWKSLVVFVGAFYLILSPWMIRNYLISGNYAVSSVGTINLYSDYGASIYSLKEGIPFHEGERKVEKIFIDKHGLPTNYFDGNVDADLVQKETKLLFKENWRLIPKIEAIVFLTFFTHDNTAYFLQKYELLKPRPSNVSATLLLSREGLSAVPKIFESLGAGGMISLLGRIVWLSAFLFSIVGTVFIRRNYGASWPMIAFLWGTMFYFALLTSAIGIGGEARLRLPVQPIILLLASLGFVDSFRLLKKKLNTVEIG